MEPSRRGQLVFLHFGALARLLWTLEPNVIGVNMPSPAFAPSLTFRCTRTPQRSMPSAWTAEVPSASLRRR